MKSLNSKIISNYDFFHIFDSLYIKTTMKRSYYFIWVLVLPILYFLPTFVAGQLTKGTNPAPLNVMSIQDPFTKPIKEVPNLVENHHSPLSTYDQLKNQGLKEDVTKRDAFSKHYQREDGSHTAVIAAGPVHYLKNGKWEEIQVNIQPVSYGHYKYANKENGLESYFGAYSTDGVMTPTNKGEIKDFLNVKMYWEINGQAHGVKAAAQKPAQVTENKLTYPHIFHQVSAEFTTLTNKRKLNYIIPNLSALGTIPPQADYLVFSEDIILPQGLSYRTSDRNEVEIIDQDGKIVLVYAKPFVLENYVHNELHKLVRDEICKFEIIPLTNGFTYKLKVKKDWLTDSARIFPIAVDPTTVYPDNAFLWSGTVDEVGNGWDGDLDVGFYFDYENDGWARFNLSTIPDNSIISSANTRLYLYASLDTVWNRRITIGDCSVDPLTVTYPYEIFNGYTQNISTSTILYDVAGFYINTFTGAGIAYVQNSLVKDYLTILAWPSSINFTDQNFARFYGYYAGLGYKPELVVNYTTTCANPSSTNGSYYISRVDFLGSLIPDTFHTSAYNTGGYYNHTTNNMATQIPGGVINLMVSNNSGLANIFLKAWVDWNKDGIFDTSELVYDSEYTYVPNTLFGFVVPMETLPGQYKIRIRTHYQTPHFFSCGSLSNGETEDYIFTVIEDCPAKITNVNLDPGDGVRCGVGSVRLTATGTGTSYKWYDSEYGEITTPGATGPEFYTPELPVGRHTFYVTATNDSCESSYRTPVEAIVRPTPDIEISTSAPDICGTTESIVINSTGDKQEVTLLLEEFTSNLGAFENVVEGNSDPNGFWMNRPNPFVPTSPPYFVIKPAVTSGFTGGNFAMILTDLNQDSDIINHLTLTSNLDTNNFLNLFLDFDLYFYSMADNVTYGYFSVDYSLNGGSSWNNLATYTTDQGNPSKWARKSYPLPEECLNNNQFRIRFSVKGLGGSGWIGNLAAIDNIRIYGDQPLDPVFEWDVTVGSLDLYEADCITLYSNSSTSSICIKPSETQLEDFESWEVKASSSLLNGCSAEGIITINNNNKYWNTPNTDWTSSFWKPEATAPTLDHCIQIKTPVQLQPSANGLAKNIKIHTSGSLTIKSDAVLTVKDEIINLGNSDNFVVESDANLLQQNPSAVNVGNIRVERFVQNMNNISPWPMDYVYWSSPVDGQQIHNGTNSVFSPGTPRNRNYDYNESDDYFYPTPDQFFKKGKGYAIRAETGLSNNYDKTYVFTGVAHNGTILSEEPLKFTDDEHGYNLIGNPYPSNLDFDLLYEQNSDKIYQLAYFWTNNIPEITQMGSSYHGNSYAVYNGTGGIPATTGDTGYNITDMPNGIVKVGQGFIVKTKSSGANKSLTFTNEMRTSEEGTFFQKTEKDRFWLSLDTPLGIRNTILIGYIPGATDGYELDFDAEILSDASDSFFSVLDGEKMVIQGLEPPFEMTDVIPIGFKLFTSGRHSISLSKKEGIFAMKDVFIRDKKANTLHNLSLSPYVFVLAAGEYENRFEIIFQSKNLNPSIKDVLANNLRIQKSAQQIVVESSLDPIQFIEIYNLDGRLIYQNTSVQSHRWEASRNQFKHEILFVRVGTDKGEFLTKKLILD